MTVNRSRPPAARCVPNVGLGQRRAQPQALWHVLWRSS